MSCSRRSRASLLSANLYYAAAFLVDDDNEFAVLVEATGKAGQMLRNAATV
jgi:hypothetical protein